jgi:hypothetical protein
MCVLLKCVFILVNVMYLVKLQAKCICNIFFACVLCIPKYFGWSLVFYNIMSNHLDLWAMCLCCYYINYLLLIFASCVQIIFLFLLCAFAWYMKISLFFLVQWMKCKKSCVFCAIYVIVSYHRPFFQKQILFLCLQIWTFIVWT